jgi:hypothetical protein
MTDLRFTRDDSYTRLYDAIVRISNASWAMKYYKDDEKLVLNYHYELDCATREAWAILRDEVAVDPVVDEVREATDGKYTDDDRVSVLRDILDDYDARRTERKTGQVHPVFEGILKPFRPPTQEEEEANG